MASFRSIIVTLLLSALSLLSSSPLTAAQTITNNRQAELLTGTCANGVPTDGSIPSSWNVRSYFLNLTDQGSYILVNGSSPGPRLTANQFDWVQVTVYSALANDSITAMHWHGLTMYDTPYNDGVAGVTQCGQESGRNVTYSFCAYPSGDYWYHSLSQLQTVRGLYGALTIAPVVLNLTANGTLVNNVTHRIQGLNTSLSDSFVSDFVWLAADQYDANATFSDYDELPTPIGVLVNGVPSNMTQIYTSNLNATYLRMLNAGSTSSFTFSVDGANMNVTALDGSQIVPYPVSSVTLSAGQRATAVLDFSSLVNYTSVYYRVARNAGTNPDWVGVLNIGVNDSVISYPNYAVSNCTVVYSNNTDGNCTVLTNNVPQAPLNRTFTDMNALSAQPINFEGIGAEYYGQGLVDIPSATYSLDLTILLVPVGDGLQVEPYINNATFDSQPINNMTISDYEQPLLYSSVITLYNAGNTSNITQVASPVLLQSTSSQYVIPSNGVVDVMLLNSDPVDHSFHMHGHHFWVTSSSDAPFANFRYANNYVVRDTVGIPANGWVRLRMVGNNPGVWLFSSATEVYLTQGFAVVLIEGVDNLTPNFTSIPADLYDLCNASIVTDLILGVAAWHSANDPVSYADTGLTQASRIVIGAVVGGVCGGVLLVIIICTLVGIKRDTVTVRKANPNARIQTPVAVPGFQGHSQENERFRPGSSASGFNPAEQTVTGTPELSERRGVEMV